ncbi:MAG: hypothetical protein LBC58_02920, partial [Clostridiales Family XIII bacterium]|nr:hypothetical protein [Clostridiales Family XIII bacterium]
LSPYFEFPYVLHYVLYRWYYIGTKGFGLSPKPQGAGEQKVVIFHGNTSILHHGMRAVFYFADRHALIFGDIRNYFLPKRELLRARDLRRGGFLYKIL